MRNCTIFLITYTPGTLRNAQDSLLKDPFHQRFEFPSLVYIIYHVPIQLSHTSDTFLLPNTIYGFNITNLAFAVMLL